MIVQAQFLVVLWPFIMFEICLVSAGVVTMGAHSKSIHLPICMGAFGGKADSSFIVITSLTHVIGVLGSFLMLAYMRVYWHIRGKEGWRLRVKLGYIFSDGFGVQI